MNNERWHKEIKEFGEESEHVSSELKAVTQALQPLATIPFFKQAKQQQAEQLKELQQQLESLDTHYQKSSALAQSITCPHEQATAVETVAKQKVKLTSAHKALQVCRFLKACLCRKENMSRTIYPQNFQLRYVTRALCFD